MTRLLGETTIRAKSGVWMEGVKVYFVVTPETGDLRRVEATVGEPDELTLARAIAAAEPGDVVATISRGLLCRVWSG
jgi:hypothetical protein